jgi:hypothetical protein
MAKYAPYPHFASCSSFSIHDQLCSDSWAVFICHLFIAFHARSPEYALKRAHIRNIFLRWDNFSQFGSFVIICKFCRIFAPRLAHIFVPPCTDPSTQPHIQESELLVWCKLNICYYYFLLWLCVLWNVVPSKPFSLCGWHDLLSFCLNSHKTQE